MSFPRKRPSKDIVERVLAILLFLIAVVLLVGIILSALRFY